MVKLFSFETSSPGMSRANPVTTNWDSNPCGQKSQLKCSENVFNVKLADNIAWVVVKLLDNKDRWIAEYEAGNNKQEKKKAKRILQQFMGTGQLKVGGQGCDHKGMTLHRRLRSCLSAIRNKHCT
jgi:hypothetical protein